MCVRICVRVCLLLQVLYERVHGWLLLYGQVDGGSAALGRGGARALLLRHRTDERRVVLQFGADVHLLHRHSNARSTTTARGRMRNSWSGVGSAGWVAS